MKTRIILLLLLLAIGSMAAIAQKRPPAFTGNPGTDSAFITFIKKNIGRTVRLELQIDDGEYLTQGYRGTIPMFDGKRTGGIYYSFFLECSGDRHPVIERCKNITWTGSATSGGTLTGYFKVLSLEKALVRNTMSGSLRPVAHK